MLKTGVRGVGGKVLRATCKSIRFGTLLARTVTDEEVKLRKELAPPYLTSGQLLGGHEVLQVTVV